MSTVDVLNLSVNTENQKITSGDTIFRKQTMQRKTENSSIGFIETVP